MGKYKYVVKTKQVDGVRYKAYGRTEREALRKLDDILFEVRQNGQKLDGNTTVRKWSKEWQWRGRIAPGTRRRRRTPLN